MISPPASPYLTALSANMEVSWRTAASSPVRYTSASAVTRRRLPARSAAAEKAMAVSYTASLREKRSRTATARSSSMRESVTRLFTSRRRRATCFSMPVSHSFSPWLSSRISQLAEMMVSGVFNSCPASVMNWRCFSTLAAIGRMARPEKNHTSANTATQMTSATAAVMSITCCRSRICVLASRKTASVPSPVSLTI